MGRRRFRLTVIVAAVSVASASSAAARRDDPHVPVPGYRCDVGKPFEGDVWGERMLDASGTQISAEMEWRKGSDVWQPRLSALWAVQGAEPIRIEDGAFFLSWNLREEAQRRRPQRLTLGITTVARARSWPNAFLVGSPDETFQHGLQGAWADMLALARGAHELFAVLRDKHGALIAQAGIDPAIFTQGARAIADAQDELEAKSNDFRHRCTPVDDVNPDIIVT